MARFYRRFLDRNVLLALGVLPPTLFLLGGHVLLGLTFLACVVAARMSVQPAGAHHHRGSPTGA
jgi:hypothetical protein